MRLARTLARAPSESTDVGAQAEAEVVGRVRVASPNRRERRALELDQDLGRGDRQAFARRGCRTARPPSARNRCAARMAAKVSTCESARDPVLVAIAAELAAHHVGRRERPDRPERLHLLVADRLGVVADRRLHREQAQRPAADDSGPRRGSRRPPRRSARGPARRSARPS